MTQVTDPNAPASDTAQLGELGGYQLLERIGAGALGDVFRARDTVHGRTVAIKRVPAALMADDERLGLLRDTCADARRRSRIPVSRCSTSAVTRTVRRFVAQEFVPGQSLTQVLAGRPINALRAVDLAVRMADALAVLHSAGLTHGDLRPDNVVVTPKGQVKLLDAGLAAFTGGGAVRASARGGDVPAASLPVVRYLAPGGGAGRNRRPARRPVCARPGAVRDAHGPAGIRPSSGRRHAARHPQGPGAGAQQAPAKPARWSSTGS